MKQLHTAIYSVQTKILQKTKSFVIHPLILFIHKTALQKITHPIMIILAILHGILTPESFVPTLTCRPILHPPRQETEPGQFVFAAMIPVQISKIFRRLPVLVFHPVLIIRVIILPLHPYEYTVVIKSPDRKKLCPFPDLFKRKLLQPTFRGNPVAERLKSALRICAKIKILRIIICRTCPLQSAARKRNRKSSLRSHTDSSLAQQCRPYAQYISDNRRQKARRHRVRRAFRHNNRA